MGNSNLLPSSRITLVGAINPASTAAGTATTGWIPMAKYGTLMALLMVGVLGSSATVDAKLRQAKDGSGTGAKDITGKAITQLVKASNDNNQVVINVHEHDLDANNSYTHVQLSVTVGTAASLLAAALIALDAAEQPATPAASVVQVVA